jgi:Cu+-exporting ATPase
MGCAACATTIETAIKKVSGVTECQVNFALERATVKYNSNITTLETIQEAVINSGYQAYLLEDIEDNNNVDTEKKAREAKQKELTHKVILGTVISLL